MKTILRYTLAVISIAFSAQAAAQITLYEREGFQGRSLTTEKKIGNFSRKGFDNHAASAEVLSDRWEVCEDAQFRGRCVILRPGRYPSLAAMGLNDHVSSIRRVDRDARINDQDYAPAPVAAQIVFYEREGFQGRSFTTEKRIGNFTRYGFHNRASSVEVLKDHWEVCENVQFSGRCTVVRPGRYPSLAAMGLKNRVSSVREVRQGAPIAHHREAPEPVVAQDYRRRNNEWLYEAEVTSVHAVLGTPEQRCWVESEQVTPERSRANVPGAIVGAIVGGILGHQVGGGRGQDIATAGGAVAGAAVGANVSRDRAQQTQTRDVQRCESIPSQARPDYWDVTYVFRGQEHQVQMSAPPGSTVSVNEQGEPRT